MTVQDEYRIMVDRLITVVRNTRKQIINVVKYHNPEFTADEVEAAAAEMFPYNVQNADMDLLEVLEKYKGLIKEGRVSPGDVYNTLFLIQHASFVNHMWQEAGGKKALPSPMEAMEAFAEEKTGVLI